MLIIGVGVGVTTVLVASLAVLISADEAKQSFASGAIMLLAVCAAVAAVTFLFLLGLRIGLRAEKTIDGAVENAERVERHRRDALAGGVPGQLSVSVEPGGEVSEPDRAGAVAIVRKERA